MTSSQTLGGRVTSLCHMQSVPVSAFAIFSKWRPGESRWYLEVLIHHPCPVVLIAHCAKNPDFLCWRRGIEYIPEVKIWTKMKQRQPKQLEVEVESMRKRRPCIGLCHLNRVAKAKVRWWSLTVNCHCSHCSCTCTLYRVCLAFCGSTPSKRPRRERRKSERRRRRDWRRRKLQRLWRRAKKCPPPKTESVGFYLHRRRTFQSSHALSDFDARDVSNTKGNKWRDC